MSGAGLVIIGGGPAGLGAAKAFRERADGPVTILSADRHPPYARPPLTKDYLRGESSADELPLEASSWYADNHVDLRLETPVNSVDRERRRVLLADGSTRDYRTLVLATGSDPQRLPVPGGDHPEVIYVRDRASGERLRAVAESARPVVVAGSGFIGCEVATSLAARGVPVVLVTDEPVPHASRLGRDAGGRIRSWLVEAGVDVRTGAGVRAIERAGDRWRVALDDGSEVGADHVVCGGGAAPNVGLAQDAGLQIRNGGVLTDAAMRTSDSTIFAVGDIAYAFNSAAGRELRVEHWGEAETHGTIAGTVAAGQPAQWSQAPGFWSGIGSRTLKYAAWGDGHDDWTMTGDVHRWVVWYRSGAELCGVLTYDDDDAYESGRKLVEQRTRFADAVPSQR